MSSPTYWLCKNKLIWKPVRNLALGLVTEKTNHECNHERFWHRFLLFSIYRKHLLRILDCLEIRAPRAHCNQIGWLECRNNWRQKEWAHWQLPSETFKLCSPVCSQKHRDVSISLLRPRPLMGNESWMPQFTFLLLAMCSKSNRNANIFSVTWDLTEYLLLHLQLGSIYLLMQDFSKTSPCWNLDWIT